MVRQKIIFGIVGSGWRAECYLQIAKLIPEKFDVCGVVTRRDSRKVELESKWGIKVYNNIDSLLKENKPDFVVMAVAKDAAAGVIKELATKEIAILAETPPATKMDELIELNKIVTDHIKIQFAEQFFLQPMHASRLSILNSGKLGEVNYSHVSISHGYHAISLIRKTLGIHFENAVIKAVKHSFPVIEGPGRNGLPETEKIVNNEHIFALLDFNGKVGFYDFEKNQHRSWIRAQRILVRGTRGEIDNTTVKYLKNYRTPIEFELRRQNAGENENLEGFYLKGILGGEEWLYYNPFLPARLSDEEIAIASCLDKMFTYVKEGTDFYCLAEVSQDQYLALMIEEALNRNEPLITETQIWAK